MLCNESSLVYKPLLINKCSGELFLFWKKESLYLDIDLKVILYLSDA